MVKIKAFQFVLIIVLIGITIKSYSQMTVASSNTIQPNTSNAQRCWDNVEIIGLEVVTAGVTPTIDLTQLRINTSGSTNILADVSNIDIYYTGTSSTFSTSNLFASVTPLAGTIVINGSQTLVNGSNYFWVTYDMIASATVGNLLDARCAQFTTGAGTFVPTTTSPTGTRTIAACNVSPGSVNSSFWVKANVGVEEATSNPAEDADQIREWLDQAGAFSCGQTTANNRPIYRDNSVDNINYHPSIEFINNSGNITDKYFDLSTPETGDFDLYMIIKTDQNTSNTIFWNQPLLYGGDINVSSDVAVTIDDSSPLHIGGGISGDFDITGTTTINDNSTKIIQTSRTVNAASNTDFAWRINGAENGSSNITATNNGAAMAGSIRIGLHSNGETESYDGFMSEIVVYNNALNSTNRTKVESYLALKYGITLLNNYVNTDNEIVYNVSSYGNDIIGIGRDDDQELSQKQSHQEDDSTRIYISTLAASNNSSNAGTFASDNQYVVMGHNSDVLKSSGSTEFPGGEDILSRLGREWKITNTNFDGTFSIDLELDTTPVNPAHLRVLIDPDGNFSNATVLSPTITSSGGVITISGLSTTEIPTNATRFLTIAFLDPVILPLGQYNFTATPTKEKTVKLNWSTTSEIDVDYFSIERSANGIDWKAIMKVESSNFSSESAYAITDKNPFLGVSFYRLKLTDSKKQHSYSQIKKVRIDRGKINIYPNPVKGQVTLSGNKIELENIKIYNVLGQDLTNHLPVINESDTKIILDVSDLKSGVYYCKTKFNTYKISKE